MVIHQFVHTLNYGDAISGEALLIQRLFTELRIESKIYCLHAHEKVQAYATNWRDFPTAEVSSEDVAPRAIILHHSLGSPLNDLYTTLHGYKRVMLYHNLTPERWFRGYNGRVVADLLRGREELPHLLRDSDIVLADSEFNRDELLQISARDIQVLPLIPDPSRWHEPANPGIANILRAHGGKNILHVGRLAPNKCVEDIIKSFYFYHHKINRKSRLWLIGSDTDTEVYSFELRRLVNELRLKDSVTFVGAAADSELRAFFENADLYISMSEHEGFCLPLLEAMHFGIPIIAFNSSAVPETLGEAGVLVSEKSPARIGELIELLLSDGALRRNAIDAGRERLRHATLSKFLKLLERLIVEPVRGESRSSALRESEPHRRQA